MRKRMILPLAGVAALVMAACGEDVDTDDQQTMAPVFAPKPAECDTKDLSSAARDFFPKEFDRQAQVLITALADACIADPEFKATDEAFDIMALMESALGGVSGLDPVPGAALAVGLLPFMQFQNCEPSGCVVDGFADHVLFALDARGAFAVRGGMDDPTDDVVSRDAEDPGTDLEAPPVWGLRPSTTWGEVLGGRALVYGYPKAGGDEGCNPLSSDCPATDEEYDWESLPDVDGFGAQMIVGTCLAVDDADVNLAFLRMRRNTTALEQTAGFDACLAFLPEQVASITERALDFLSPWPGLLLAAPTKTGPGGNASDFSDFTPLNATPFAELVISEIPDAFVGDAIGPISVTARTANGTPLERVQVVFTPQDNNGSWTATYAPGGTESCGEDCRYTEEEGGTAVLEGIALDKTGGYRVCATVKAGGDLGFTFVPDKVCSNGFNVRP